MIFLFFLTYYIREGRHEERSSGKTFLKEDVLIFKLEKGNNTSLDGLIHCAM